MLCGEKLHNTNFLKFTVWNYHLPSNPKRILPPADMGGNEMVSFFNENDANGRITPWIQVVSATG